jgi:hypothetical protein
MSAGDIDNDAWPEHQVMAEFQNDPELYAYTMMIKNIDQQYDIPYCGGISLDGRRPYLDRHFPRFTTLSTGYCDIGFFIGNFHEAPEWFMVVKRNFSYTAAHHFANGVENMMVKKAGHYPREYNAYIDMFIPGEEHEKIKITPRDLALYPYADDKKLMARIKEKMA